MKYEPKFPMLIQSGGNQGANRFLHALNDSNLIFYVSDLLDQMGLSNLSELEESLERAHEIFSSTHISEDKNIRMIFRDDHGQIFCDWKISRLAYYLLTINGLPSNPKVGRTQIKMYQKFNNHIKS